MSGLLEMEIGRDGKGRQIITFMNNDQFNGKAVNEKK